MKKNALGQIICDMDIEAHKGAGFYTLCNIKASKDTFLDIQILIDEGIESKEDLRTIQEWNTLSRSNAKVLPAPKTDIKLILPTNQSKNQLRPATSRFFSPQKTNTGQLNLGKNNGSSSKFVALAQVSNKWTNDLRQLSPAISERSFGSA